MAAVVWVWVLWIVVYFETGIIQMDNGISYTQAQDVVILLNAFWVDQHRLTI